MFTFRIIFLLFFFHLNFELCFCGCARAEYKINNQCCPMCAAGNYVIWHCTEDTSTTCAPCPASTFINEPNGLTKCFPCTVCYARQSLRVRKACTRSSDTVCEPLEGFYCISKHESSCSVAMQHSQCIPGQYIKQTGTDATDTVCADCTGETYSNGSFLSCLPHRKCEAMGLTETNPGTHSSDAECGNPPADSTVIAIVIGAALIVLTVMLSLFIIKWRQKRKHVFCSGHGVQESRKASHEEVCTSAVDTMVNECSPSTLSVEDQVTLMKNPNSLEIVTVPHHDEMRKKLS